MKKLILLLPGLFLALLCHAQTKSINLTKESLAKPKTFGKGAMLILQYDSVIVFDNTLHKQSLLAFKNTLSQFELIKQQYDSCLFYSSDNARKLSNVSLQLAKQINLTVDSASVILLKTKQNLDQTIANLNSANANLNSIESLLKQEQRNRRKRAIAWGAGGFGVGIVTTALVSLLIIGNK